MIIKIVSMQNFYKKTGKIHKKEKLGKIGRERERQWVRGSVSWCGLIIYVPLFSYIQMIKWQLLKFRWKIFKCLFEHASWPATTATIIKSRMLILWRNCASLKLSARKYEISARQLNFLNLLQKETELRQFFIGNLQ